MTEPTAGRAPAVRDDDKISVFALATVVVRRRWQIMAMALVGLVLGLTYGLSKGRVYASSATFIPEQPQGSTSNLAMAASQLGFNIPASGGGWGPPMYVELIRSRALLEPIALDTFVVAEEQGQRKTFIDLMKIKAPTHDRAVAIAVVVLGGLITATEDKKLGGVTVEVRTAWPSVSLALANRLVQRVNQFNLETRQSQAAAERKFVEAQVSESQQALLEAENRLQVFLQANREFGGSPGLAFDRDRLQREVARRNQLYTSWLQSREEARIREIRDTPVITVFESPRLAFVSEPRGAAFKGILGAIAGAMLGILFAFLADSMAGARRSKREDAEEFFQVIERATPRVLKRKAR